MGGDEEAGQGHIITRALERELKPEPHEDGFVIVLLRGKVLGRAWPCRDRLIIGRDPRAEITVADDSVSRRHARVERGDDGSWWIVDLDSRNGVYLNGHSVQRAAMRPGDRIHIGERCIFKFSRSDALERQMVESQKLEALGRLASGIAHDYNNILMVISANAAYIQESFRPGVTPDIPDLLVSLSMINDATKRASQITGQLLDFARKGTERPERVNLGQLTRGAIEMANRALNSNVVVHTDIDDFIVVAGAEGRLSQVVLNLCLNASDAMVDGGVITLSVGSTTLGARVEDDSYAVPAGDWALLTVTDTGSGISEEERARIFEPFYTTKRVGHGTGLGLAMVYGIVTQHGGHIVVSSESGEGAVFKVYLPRLEYREPEKHRREVTPPVVGGGVLLVDDDYDVRWATRRLLEAAGFTVTEVSGGREAVHVFQSESKAYQFVLLDLVMPGMSGLETYRELRAISPSAIILLCSGGGKNQADVALAEGANGFVGKPYTLKMLMAAFADARIDKLF